MGLKRNKSFINIINKYIDARAHTTWSAILQGMVWKTKDVGHGHAIHT